MDGACRTLPLLSILLSSDIQQSCCVSCSAHTALSLMRCATRPTGSNRHTHAGHWLFFIMQSSPDIPTDMLRFLLGSHCLFAHALCNSPYGLKQAQTFAAVCSSRRKPRNCLWEYPRRLYCVECPKMSHDSDYLKIKKVLIGSRGKCCS